jgi:hypothetical protein
MATNTAAKKTAPATRTPIEAALIRQRKAREAVNEARAANPYRSSGRDEAVVEFAAASAEVERLVDALIAAE